MKHTLSSYVLTILKDTWNVFTMELKRVFRDPGVILLFFVAGLLYPVIYNLIYYKNMIQDVPVAVVDMCGSQESRRFIHEWDATAEVMVSYPCANLTQAQELLRTQKVHGILYIPADYSAKIASGLETAKVSLYADMSSFLYMKNVLLSANMVALDEMQNIEIKRYEQMNIDDPTAWALVQGVRYEGVSLYNPTGGYGAFLVPAVLVLILHQTLLFGILMLCGTANEENKEVFLLPGKRRRYSVFRIITGRSIAYFVIYMAISAFDLILIPRIFDLPHLGNNWDIMKMVVPFLFATIYMAMTIGAVLREREAGMVTLLFVSVIFIFISGVSWPFESMPAIWQAVAKIIPSTWGIQGYVHLNTMGANLATTIHEYNSLWILAGAWFGVCIIVYLIRSRIHEHAQVQKERIAALRKMVKLRQEAKNNEKLQNVTKKFGNIRKKS